MKIDKSQNIHHSKKGAVTKLRAGETMRKVDLAMWAKNGASMLPTVLKRIDEVIPSEAIGRKIFVDDHSTDGTPSIAKDFGWSVYVNKKGGVGSGASTALRHVTNAYFISIEQDVLLARDWFEKIPKYLENEGVAVAQGWRISNHPVIGKIDEHRMERNRATLGSVDNNIYKTKIMRALGGFPEHLKYVGVDVYVRKRVVSAGFKWVVDSTVISAHLRTGGLREEMRRNYLYGIESDMPRKEALRRSASIAFFSPFRGLEIAVKKKCPQIVYYYPLTRFSNLKGCLEKPEKAL